MTALTTIQIRLVEILGDNVANAIVSFELDRFDTDPDLGTIVPNRHLVTTDSGGESSINLWPNQAGSRGSQYKVQVTLPDRTTPIFKTKISVPEAATPVVLWSIISDFPFPAKSDAQLAQEAAQQSAADAAQSADDAQAAAAINQRVPDPTGQAAGQVVQTDGNNGYRLAEAGSTAPATPEIRRRDAGLGFVRTRNIVWDDMDPGIATTTPMIGATLPSGQTWQAVPAQDDSGTIVADYHPNGLAQMSRSPLNSQINPLQAPFLLVDFASLYKQISVQFTAASIGQNWARWVCLNWLDANNFIAASFGDRTVSLVAVQAGVVTVLGELQERTTSQGGTVSRNSLVRAEIALYYNVWAGIAGVELVLPQSGRRHQPIPAGFESLIAAPGKIGFSAPRTTALYGFSAIDLGTPAEGDFS